MKQKKKNNTWIIIFVAVFIVLILFSLGLFAWNFLKTTPKYSLYQVYSAVKHKNYKQFVKYVDIDAVVENVLNQSSEDLTDLKDLSKTLLKRQIERGKFFGSDRIRSNTILDMFRFWDNTELKMINTIAQASISSGEEKLQFHMKKLNHRWQVFRIDLEINQILGLVKDRSDSQALSEEEQKLLHFFELKVKGFLALKADKLTEGINALEEVLAIKEDKTLRQYLDDAYFERGEYFFSIGDLQKAQNDLSHCSKKNSKAQVLLRKIKTTKK